MSWIRLAFLALSLVTLTTSSSRAVTIFDSRQDYPFYPMASTSGGPLGGASVFDVSTDTTIHGISLLNVWLDDGPIKFVIFSAVTRELLFESEPLLLRRDVFVGAELDATPTWKDSPPFSFTLLGGHRYAIGSTSYSERRETFDIIPNSMNGISSTMQQWVVRGYSSMNAAPLTSGSELAIRLTVVPEPPSAALLATASALLGIFMRRKKLGTRLP